MTIEELSKLTPDYVLGDFKWYLHKRLQYHLTTSQSESLPALKNYACFIVSNPNKNILDIVLINNKQEVIKHYSYNSNNSCNAEEQMECFINVFKIANCNEKDDVQPILQEQL